MTTVRRYAFVILVVAAALSSIDCHFDRSGIAPSSEPFVGCFQGNNLDGVLLHILHEGNDLLSGTLGVGQAPNTDVYALSGRATTDWDAVLEGANNNGVQIELDLRRDPNNQDLLRMIIADGPAMTLNRC